jgi:hypothetical protein
MILVCFTGDNEPYVYEDDDEAKLAMSYRPVAYAKVMHHFHPSRKPAARCRWEKRKGGTEMRKIEPCPSCGSTDIFVDCFGLSGGSVWCNTNNCGFGCWGATEQQAVDNWNRRTPPPATAEIIAIWRREAKYRKQAGGYLPERIERMLAEWPDATHEEEDKDA